MFLSLSPSLAGSLAEGWPAEEKMLKVKRYAEPTRQTELTGKMKTELVDDPKKA